MDKDNVMGRVIDCKFSTKSLQVYEARLCWCEQALDFPWNPRRSLLLDEAVIAFEAAREAARRAA